MARQRFTFPSFQRLACWLFALSSASLFLQAQEAEPPVWHSRYQPAVDAANAEGKSIMVVFTGSEWIDICKKFEADILSQKVFTDAVRKKYVLLKLEYPEDNRLSAELAKEYQLLKDAYRVRGFPTVLVTDQKGLPFGMNGYQPIPAERYAQVMLALHKGREIRDAAMSKAANQTGVDRAKTLVDAIPDLPGTLSARYYRKVIEEVIALDPEDETGYQKAFQRQLADVDYSSLMQRLGADVQYAAMLDATDKYIQEQDLKGELLQKALLNKLGVQQKQRDIKAMIETLLSIVQVDSKSHFGQSAQKMLNNLRAKKIQDSLAK